MIRVGVVGGTGRLGRDIIKLIVEREDIVVGAVTTRSNNLFAGKDVGSLVDDRIVGTIIRDNLVETIEYCDVYIDCTIAEAFMENYDTYLLAGKPVIIATTGFSEQELERIKILGRAIPVAICPNFSIGVYKFLKLIKLAAKEFGVDADIDVFEYHHKYKKDKPSGTAVQMVNSIRDSGIDEPINIHSVRAGNIIGEHSVLFTTSDNERIELSHKIYAREGFSRGVVTAIKWIADKEAGLYGLEDIFCH